MTDDTATALLAGPRGRRLCLDYARTVSTEVGEVLFWLAYHADPNPGTLFRFTTDGEDDSEHEDPNHRRPTSSRCSGQFTRHRSTTSP